MLFVSYGVVHNHRSPMDKHMDGWIGAAHLLTHRSAIFLG